ncbi:MAG: hypothetical protein NW201_06705 [Gemmatimonadales bacterium]|nr:hypothetical protein [Gemmatimonadales bacterium]
MSARSVTLSARGVILSGQSFVDVNVCLPKCPRKAQFLVQGVHVGPEVEVGATSIDVVRLPRWAVSVSVYQLSPAVAIRVPLTALAQGAEHISATIPAGQTIGPLAGSPFIPVRITLLGGVAATHRFEFNVHITGTCGDPYICTARSPSTGRRARGAAGGGGPAGGTAT